MGFYNLGVAYAAIDATDESIAAFKRVIELNPKYPDAYYNLGVAYSKKNQFDEAIQLLKSFGNQPERLEDAFCPGNHLYGQR